ncbi:DUF1801 domain-containing protein [Flavobacteriaceae bacterium TP-CH-4]|uniref:DUF1801 domain-containing protein n=1 Tax=Pelagihabitans pacificus TaxID=2696054 RepID=A0A967AQQ2_9FLAO|nr:DUF1801 domain-containing protein [Pelagihabitans pacificus]NHF58619.1 DUF1801 domain-containing protein [Pelagihabitans pacificus]
MKANPALSAFLEPYPPSIRELTLQLRTFVLDSVPETNELLWDNYNAVALAYSKSERLRDAFCHIAVYAKHVNFGFNRGAELSSDYLPLLGKGKLIRHIKVNHFDTFPQEGVRKLLLDAVARSEQLHPELVDCKSNPKSIVMSISEKKIRPK